MSFFNELKRRNVIRVAAAYVVIGWLLLQVADTLTPALHLPEWIASAIALVLILGIIPTLLFSWAYELTPEGLKKDSEVDKSKSDTSGTAKKLDIITLVAVGGVVVLVAWQQLSPGAQSRDQFRAADVATESEPGDAEFNEAAEVTPSLDEISSKSIAVLPFTNMANNAENEPFTLGLHDDLLTHLSRISALKVISRTSVMQYRDTTKPIRDIAGELGVAHILEGGVQRAGNQIRLNVQLIDANTDEHLWAEIYDRELTTENIFKIQTEISQEIAKALRAQLTPAETKSIETAPTDNLEAYDAYLAGRHLLEERNSDSIEQALSLFRKATKLDPNYALAYVGQATSINLLFHYSDLPQTEMLAQAEPLVTRALALDPLLAEAHTMKGGLLAGQEKFAEAEATYKLSLSLNPNYATTYHWYGYMLRNRLGRYEEALAMYRKAVELDPHSKIIMVNYAASLDEIGKKEEALKQYQKLLELHPDFAVAVADLADMHAGSGNFAQAIVEQEKAVALDPGDVQWRLRLSLLNLAIENLSAAQSVLDDSKKISPQHFLYVFIQTNINVFEGKYQAALQDTTAALADNPENSGLKSFYALILALNDDCQSALNVWQSAEPEKFDSEYVINERGPTSESAIVWCLKQTGNDQKGDLLLGKIQEFLNTSSNLNNRNQVAEIDLLVLQGNTQQAAQAYALSISASGSFLWNGLYSSWYWFDHLPLYAELRKEPVFTKARAQLMKGLAAQRAMLAEYRQQNGAGQ